MNSDFVWIFNNSMDSISGGVFRSKDIAEKWIKENSLNGILTKYPLDQGVLDWAIENDLVGMRPETLENVKNNPKRVGEFTSASMEHFHYEGGEIIK
ncbi:hypothetical protein V6R21_10290 [Limibacter armeniacum]|uniref:DUF7710 domain-containing protein n=1 Tax=Limibacter armeniacum TaxID=466084 RepID=UPI002FE52C9E